MHQVRVPPNVVVHGGQLDQLAQQGDLACRAEVLVADDGFGDGFGLGLRGGGIFRGRVLEEAQGEDAAVKLEGELCGAEVLVRGADIVEEAG